MEPKTAENETSPPFPLSRVDRSRKRCLRILYAAPGWPGLAAELSSLMTTAAFELTKRTRRTTAGFLAWRGERVFVKRITARRAAFGLVARISGSRAARALRGARILSAAGFAHPAMRLAVEERRFGSVRASYIVTEALDRARIFSQAVLPRARPLALRRELARRAATEIRRLHDSGIYTRDLQETNLMVDEDGAGAAVFYFVDLEDFRRVRRVSKRLRMRNLVHLDRSIGRFASRAKRLRFLYDYEGGPDSRSVARRLVSRYLASRKAVEGRGARCRTS